MRKRHWIIAGLALLASSCQSGTKQAKVQPPLQIAQPNAERAASIVSAQATILPPIKVPGIIPISDSKAQMPVAVSSTRDPFAAATIPTELKATLQPALPKSIAGASIAAASSTSAQPVIPLPQPIVRLAPVPQPAPLRALPALPIPPSIAQNTNLTDAIALTGVIQTGSKLSAIVQDSDGSSRDVQVGESLANGQVTVKKINLNSVGAPSIVLVYNGIELIKTVGRSEG